ncbi:MAG: UDP-N-acetylmuramoylalanine-D-glutamate ligase [Parcubacteria group bacterium GW2011_GWA2_44_13]|nr:MAG: UDP-N-acetylmuramoylalanine-D-glutamate ligase [Parcubacteria group bacterium GW2011_GWA2_44_13]
MKIAILGYGVEGKSAEKFLKSSLSCRTAKCWIEIRDVKKQGKGYLKNLDKFDMVVRSPGIPFLSPEIQRAKKAGVEITSTTKLFFQNAKGILVGITGTKGKGTTATLLYKILKASHLATGLPSGSVHLIGNMGIPMLDELPKLKKNSISILELSSFQLQDLDVSPHIAVVLDISPDHLNYHKSFKEYLEAKFPICNFQFSKNKAFYFSDNRYSEKIAMRGHGKKIPVLSDKNLKLKIPGAHNGIRFYNDSASTNPAATVAAISAFKEPKILIAGGAGKNLDYRPIGKVLKNSNTKLIILNGQNRKEIGRAISGAESSAPHIIYVKNLRSAINLAYKNVQKGGVIIFSPASTGFDQFSGYGERGEFFKHAVVKLK